MLENWDAHGPRRRPRNSQDIELSRQLQSLVPRLRDRFSLAWRGVHGAPHWARVRDNGLLLAPSTGADRRVVQAFAFLHDVCRESDNTDPLHGARAAQFAGTIRDALRLDDEAFDLLCEACEGHSNGRTKADPTVMTCWDADRLDLGRVGIRPDPKYLCTDAAQQRAVMRWAWNRSRKRSAQELMRSTP